MACYHWLTTSAAITAKAAAWPTMKESRDGRPQTTRDTPEGVQKPSINETKLSSPFNRKSHVTDQDFTEFSKKASHFQLLDKKAAKVFDSKCSLFYGLAKYLRGPVPVRGPAVENHWFKSPLVVRRPTDNTTENTKSYCQQKTQHNRKQLSCVTAH